MSFNLDSIDTTLLTENDLQILSFVRDNLKLVSTIRLKDLSDQLFLSEASIIRFSQKIGFSGFTQLKISIKEELTPKFQKTDFRDQIDTQINNLNSLINQIQPEQINEAVNLICSNSTLYIHGRGMSTVPAEYLHTMLNSLDRRCILIKESQLLNSISRTAKPDSVIIIVSASASSDIYQQVVETAHLKHSKVILITSNSTSSLLETVDAYLLGNDATVTYYKEEFNSRIEIITLVQFLIESVIPTLSQKQI